MANRFFLIFVAFVSFLSAATTLNELKVENSTLKLGFSTPLKKEQLRTFIIPAKNIYKYVFDFKDCKKSKKIGYMHKLKGSVKSIRVSQYKPNTIRLVIDSKVKYLLNYNQKDGSTFNISLPDKTTIIKQKPKPKKSKKKKKTDIKDLFKNSSPILNTKKQTPPPLDLNSPIINSKRKYLIYLDPGHGGSQPGAVYGGIKEKHLVYQITRRVYRKLKQLGYRVKMTRYKDKRVSLSRRTRMANKANADIFISIHANAVSDRSRINKAYGLETYFLQKSRTQRAKRIAAIENREILSSKDRVTQDVLLNAVFTGPKIKLSHILATSVQQNILSNVRGKYRIKDNGVAGAPFRVLVGAQMPAILIEVGYISNPKERAKLLSSTYQDTMANGIVAGIVKYIKYRENELN
jgi:N-acetylmuramoyl-L-alanine amidase